LGRRRRLPTGAPRPLERETMRVVKPRATSLASTPRKVAALKSRAPSRWVGRPWAWARAWTAFCTSLLRSITLLA
jgi:hypothetical protein